MVFTCSSSREKIHQNKPQKYVSPVLTPLFTSLVLILDLVHVSFLTKSFPSSCTLNQLMAGRSSVFGFDNLIFFHDPTLIFWKKVSSAPVNLN